MPAWLLLNGVACDVSAAAAAAAAAAVQNARNVLVAGSSEASIGVQGKLADLGLSRSVTQHKTHRTTNTVRLDIYSVLWHLTCMCALCAGISYALSWAAAKRSSRQSAVLGARLACCSVVSKVQCKW